MLVLHPPFEAPIVRAFRYQGSPFARGLHRGVDFATRPGAVVRSPCDGRVVWAGSAGVTLECANRRVTLLPVAPDVAAGGSVRSGARIGRAGSEPLHLGVRRPGDAFGYEDPERYLRAAPPAVPVVGPRRTPRPWRSAPSHRAVRHSDPVASAGPAPWLAWAGLAVALAGAVGGGAAKRRRARTRTVPARAGPGTVS